MSDTKIIRQLSDELVALQQPIRVLDAVAWGDEIADSFFANGAQAEPEVDAECYANHRPLRFEPEERRAGFRELRSRISSRLGESTIAALLVGRVDEYLRVIDLLEARGTPSFALIAAEP